MFVGEFNTRIALQMSKLTQSVFILDQYIAIVQDIISCFNEVAKLSSARSSILKRLLRENR